MEVLVNLYHSEVDHKDFFFSSSHIHVSYEYKHFATCVIFQICFYFRRHFLLLSVAIFCGKRFWVIVKVRDIPDCIFVDLCYLFAFLRNWFVDNDTNLK